MPDNFKELEIEVGRIQDLSSELTDMGPLAADQIEFLTGVFRDCLMKDAGIITEEDDQLTEGG